MAYQALYRRYRPRRFEDVAGQDAITTTLKNQVRTGRIAHAYLFCGSRGTGKTTTAKIFARAINCEHAIDGEPCDTCESCLGNGGDGVDIIEIDAASNNGVDEIRDLREKVRFSPLSGRYKTYIIDEVHMLSAGAFNALLKTLEEPPAHAVFILATTEPQKLPATIHSRCQRYEFHRIPVSDIVARLKIVLADVGAAFEEGGLRAIARAAEGGLRDALSLADQCIAYCGNDVSTENVLSVLGSMDAEFLFSLSRALIDSDERRTLTLFDQIFQCGRDLNVFCRDLTAHFRNLMLISACGDARDLFDCTDEAYEQYRLQAADCPLERSLRAISLLAKAEADMKYLAYPRVLFEAALLRICRPQDEESVEALTDRVAALESALSSGNVQIPAQSMQNKQESELPQSIREEKEQSAASLPRQAPKETPPLTPRLGKDEQERELFELLLPLLPRQTQALATSPAMPWSLRLEGSTLLVLIPEKLKPFSDALNAKAEDLSRELSKSKPGISVRFGVGTVQAVKKSAEEEIPRIKKMFGEDIQIEIIREKDTF